MLAGARNYYNVPGLDLFNGLTVQYDSGKAPEAVSVATCYEAGLAQMTAGCALVLLMTRRHIEGRSFTVTNKQRKWLDFARENTVKLNTLMCKLRQQLERTQRPLVPPA